jgi:hypothetical protein
LQGEGEVEVGEKDFDFLTAHILGVTVIMEQDVVLDPVDVWRLFYMSADSSSSLGFIDL